MPTEKIGNYQTSLKGGGRYPHFGKTPNYFRFFLMKASLSAAWNSAQTRKRTLAPWPPKTEKWGGIIYKCQEHISSDHLKKKLGLWTPRLNFDRSCKIGF